MSMLPWARGRGRRRADASELARQSWADAVAIAQRNHAARVEWERQCRDAVQRSGPAPIVRRRVGVPPVRPVVVLVVGVMLH